MLLHATSREEFALKVLPASLEPREKAEVSKVISFDSLKPN
jgi:hypothetical protein